jgi:hypothetical protein
MQGCEEECVGKPERERPLRRHGCGWEENIKLDEIGWSSINWTDLAQGRDQWRHLVNTVINFRFP